MSEHTPTTGEIESHWMSPVVNEPDAGHGKVIKRERQDQWDRWLAAHDAEVRKDEREKVAVKIETAVWDGKGNRTPPSEADQAAWLVGANEGIEFAARIARGATS